MCVQVCAAAAWLGRVWAGLLRRGELPCLAARCATLPEQYALHAMPYGLSSALDTPAWHISPQTSHHPLQGPWQERAAQGVRGCRQG